MSTCEILDTNGADLNFMGIVADPVILAFLNAPEADDTFVI